MKPEITIQSIRDRPRFKLVTSMSREEFVQKLKKHLLLQSATLGGFANLEVSTIYIKKDREKYWSPQLQIRLEDSQNEPGMTEIRGVFGPRPSVWTFFIFLYAMGGGIILTLGIFGWVEYALGIGKFWVWSNLLGLLLILTAYLISHIAQIIARPQMKVLRTFMENVLVEENLV